MIDVETFLRQHSVAELCATAEAYYAHRDPEALLVHDARKPFGNLVECAQSLHRLGLLFSGLRLGHGMTVLEFGAGLGWLSRHLNQLGCETIAVDVSETALRLGQEAFDRYYIGDSRAPASWLHFDGHHLEWPAGSVDRVICFDALHHVPNPGVALREMARVLRDGGIAAFAEPGRDHSRTAAAQMEMQSTITLENDVRLEEVFALAKEVGFTDLVCQQGVEQGTRYSLEEYLRMAAPEAGGLGRLGRWWRRRVWPRPLRAKVRWMVAQGMAKSPVFFLHKGPFRMDSRSPEELRYAMRVGPVPAAVTAGQALEVDVTVTNTGGAHWLAEGREMTGVVRLGVSLLDLATGHSDPNHYRLTLGREVAPGGSVQVRAEIPMPRAGRARLRLDLVAEHVVWFERLGSSPVELEIEVV